MLVVKTCFEVGTGSVDVLGFGAGVALDPDVVGAAVTVLGIVFTEEMFWTGARPAELTPTETTVIHTGLPARAESRVTFKGKVPEIGVVSISTWRRSIPEGSVLRVTKLKEMGVFPAEPARATYEASETVNSKE